MSVALDVIRAAPKVSLHDHLDGGLRPQTIIDLAAEIGHELPATERRRTGRLDPRRRQLGTAGALPVDLRAHRRGDAERGQPAPGRPRVRRGPGRRRGRLRRDPVGSRAARRGRAHPGPGGGGGPGRAGRGDGAAAASPGTRSWSGSCSPPCVTTARPGRSPTWRSTTGDQGVAGFDIAGAEAGYPPTRYLDAFDYLKRNNAFFTIHAGEAFGLPSIWEAVQICGANRLGHGVRIIDDITLGPDGSPSWVIWPPTSVISGSRWRCARPPTCTPVRRHPSPSTPSGCCGSCGSG